MRITIIRHGKVNMKWPNICSLADFDKACEEFTFMDVECFGYLGREGKFWWEHQWCENDLYEAENFREECSQEKMIEKMQQMQDFFKDCGLDEYVEVYRKAEQFVKEQKRIAD